LLVLNKVDLLPDPQTAAAEAETVARRILGEASSSIPARAAAVSARNGEGTERLLGLIDEAVPLDPVAHAVFRFPPGESAEIHLLHEGAHVTKTVYSEEFYQVEADAPESLRRRLSRFLVPAAG
jgi:50S ribosomal subunit-associated GTPase HflX